MMRLYLDTNVIMDFFLDRRSSSILLFKKILSCLHEVVISDFVLRELELQKVDMKLFIQTLTALRKLEIVSISEEDKIIARTIHQTHYADALHYVLAKRADVGCLVTSNIKDFSCFKDISIKRPDNL